MISNSEAFNFKKKIPSMTRLNFTSVREAQVGELAALAPDALRELERVATKLRIARGQSRQFSQTRSQTVLIVRSGYLVVRVEHGQGGRLGVVLMPPSSICWLSSLQSIGPVSITAAEPTLLMQVDEAWLDQRIESDASLGSYILQQTRRQITYDRMHIALLSALRGEERLAGFLLAMAALGGKVCGTVMTLDLPLSRSDLAHHLALNPDTLSRIVSRFKASGFISMPNRRTLRIIDPAGLSALRSNGRSGPVNPA